MFKLFLANKKLEGQFLPFSIIIDLMGHFEEDISSKPPPYATTSCLLTFIEITEPIFPNKNPETKIHLKLKIIRMRNMVFSHNSLLITLPVPFVSFGAIKSTSSIIPPAMQQ